VRPSLASQCPSELASCLLQRLLGIANLLLCFALTLLCKALGLLLTTAEHLAGLLLHLACGFLDGALDLMLLIAPVKTINRRAASKPKFTGPTSRFTMSDTYCKLSEIVEQLLCNMKSGKSIGIHV
jgi:hypothetical protein